MGSSFRGAIFTVFCVVLFTVSVGNEERIVGGKIATKKYRRHLAHIAISDGSSEGSCTGSIIGRRYVLTAAHCFDSISDVKVSDSRLYIGLRTANPGPAQKWYGFDAVYIHKDYDQDDSAARNDVAVVKLSEDISSGMYFPVSLGRAPKPDTVVVAAGYGVLDESGTPAKYAMQTNVVSKSFKLCKSREPFVSRDVRRRLHVCAVSVGFPDEGTTDTCYGDSGGPLFRKKGGKIQQYGITSFATTGCAAPGGIPWYVRVSAYKKSLEELVSTGSSSDFVEYV